MTTSTVYDKPQIVIKKTFNHSTEKVWKALTDPEALATWLMPTTDFELKEGCQFQFKTTPRGKFDGIVDCQINEIHFPSRIQYTWKAKGMPQPTLVTWVLKPLSESSTLLTLSHNGFVGFNGWLTKTMLGFGWKKLLNKKLRNYLIQ